MSVFSTLKTEDELLLSLIQTHLNPKIEEKITNLLTENEIDWIYLLNKASCHGVMPLLYVNLKNNFNVPNDLLETLKEYFFKNTNKNLMFLGELLKILRILRKKGIKAIPYKGPILAVQGYGNLSLREFGDLDLLIDKADLAVVKKILTDENFEPVLKLNSSKEAKFLKSQREFKFQNRLNDLILEIQWNAVGFSFSFPRDHYFPINKQFNSIYINNHHIDVLCDEDLILILSTHAAGHLWSRLSWICDIAQIIKKSEDLNWEKIIEKARYLSIERILYLNLFLAHELFNLNLSKKLQTQICDDPQIRVLGKKILKLIFCPEQFSIQNKVDLRFKMRENKINGFKDIFRILTIPQSDEWASFDDNRSITILYILKRPVQIIKRLKS